MFDILDISVISSANTIHTASVIQYAGKMFFCETLEVFEIYINSRCNMEINVQSFHTLTLIIFRYEIKAKEKNISCQNNLIHWFVYICNTTKPIEISIIAIVCSLLFISNFFISCFSIVYDILAYMAISSNFDFFDFSVIILWSLSAESQIFILYY